MKTPVSDIKLLDCIEGKKPHHWLGKKHKPETIEKIRQSMRVKNPMKNPDTAKKMGETIRKSKSRIGEKNPKWNGGSRKYRGGDWPIKSEERRDCVTCGS